jgi:hypothetical protein
MRAGILNHSFDGSVEVSRCLMPEILPLLPFPLLPLAVFAPPPSLPSPSYPLLGRAVSVSTTQLVKYWLRYREELIGALS